MNNQPSRRLQQMAPSATIMMAAMARKLKQQGKTIYNLGVGEPDFATPPHIVQGAIEQMQSGRFFGYAPVNGYEDLREVICEKLKNDNALDFQPEQIVVSNGAKQSIANTLLSLVDPGQEVIILSPHWVTYPSLVLLAGGIPKFVRGQFSNNFKVRPEDLQKAITPNTRALLFSCPSNPSGTLYSRKELEGLAEVIRLHPHLMVVSDEIYELLAYGGDFCSFGSLEGVQEQTVTINGFSKGYAMTGWRVGYFAGPQWLAKAVTKLQGQLTSACSSISQRAAYTALTTDRGPSQQMAEAYKTRMNRASKILAEMKDLELVLPAGGFYFFPRVRNYLKTKKVQDTDSLCLHLLEKWSTSVVSGTAFGEPEHLRISFAAPMEEVISGVTSIRKCLEDINS